MYTYICMCMYTYSYDAFSFVLYRAIQGPSSPTLKAEIQALLVAECQLRFSFRRLFQR